MKKTILVCLALAIAVCLFSVTAQAATEGDFQYDVKDGAATVTGYLGAGGDVTIPDILGGYPVTAIGEGAFSSCTDLTEITIPESVAIISNKAFEYCFSLSTVNMGSGVTHIGKSAFYRCEILSTVNYTGSAAQWEQVYIAPPGEYFGDNRPLSNATLVTDYVPSIPEETIPEGGISNETIYGEFLPGGIIKVELGEGIVGGEETVTEAGSVPSTGFSLLLIILVAGGIVVLLGGVLLLAGCIVLGLIIGKRKKA